MLRQQSQRDPVAPTATNDNCGILTVTNDSPATFPKGDTIVTWTVVDTAGNTASCTLKVTVKDHEPPVLAGQGADEARLRQLADELRVSDRLHLVGEITPRQMAEFLAALDVFVFPTQATPGVVAPGLVPAT